jgi:hypothetical protein
MVADNPNSPIPPKAESDPNGIDQHEPGAKLDAGKLMAALLLQFPHALEAIAQIATYGARKYSPGGWLSVPDGINRYADAEWRHKLKRAQGEERDPESGRPHRWHEAWNVLAQLELTECPSKAAPKPIGPLNEKFGEHL